jgi:hypothetical protein
MPNETRGRFDTEIDRAVRGMMNVDPSPGMRHRVGARLDTAAPARRWHASWAVPAFAAAVVLLAVATAVALFPPPIADAPAAPQLAAGPAPVTEPLPDDLGTRTNAPSVEAERSREASQPRTGGSESIFGAPTQMVSAASLPGGQATAAQEPKPADKPPAPSNPDQPINIKLDLSITDQVGTGDPVKKTMSMIVADGLSGTIRNTGNVKDQGRVQIRVEARPKILPSGQIRLMLALEYVPRAPGSDTPLEGSALHEQISTIIEPGTPVIVTQSADPASDRKVLVEVKATLVK